MIKRIKKKNKYKLEAKKLEVLKFALSYRGNFIISQALWYAIRELKKVKPPHREESNISDMKFLMDNFFNLFSIFKNIEDTKKYRKFIKEVSIRK
jgi:hypothetical protein